MDLEINPVSSQKHQHRPSQKQREDLQQIILSFTSHLETNASLNLSKTEIISKKLYYCFTVRRTCLWIVKLLLMHRERSIQNFHSSRWSCLLEFVLRYWIFVKCSLCKGHRTKPKEFSISFKSWSSWKRSWCSLQIFISLNSFIWQRFDGQGQAERWVDGLKPEMSKKPDSLLETLPTPSQWSSPCAERSPQGHSPPAMEMPAWHHVGCGFQALFHLLSCWYKSWITPLGIAVLVGQPRFASLESELSSCSMGPHLWQRACSDSSSVYCLLLVKISN